MSKKTMYLYKVTMIDCSNQEEKALFELRDEINRIIDAHEINSAINLTYDENEPVVMDILVRNNEYLFARLSKKKINHSVIKRNYQTLEKSSVLTQAEEDDYGIELFTYCILGYSHGIMSIAKALGAPNEAALNRLFSKFNTRYSLKIDNIPNTQLIDELYNGRDPEINYITIEIPTPDAAMIRDLYKINDEETIRLIQEGTQSIIISSKPESRGSIIKGQNQVKTIIDALRGNSDLRKILLNAKPNDSSKRKQYDLFERYFRYEIAIEDYHKINNQVVEYTLDEMQTQFFDNMTEIYNEYKSAILGICGRR